MLERMALDRWGSLTEAERRMLAALEAGQAASFDPPAAGEEDEQPAEPPPRAGENERTVRAALIRWLALDVSAAERLSHSGIRIVGARVNGRLDLSHSRVRLSLAFERCMLSEGLDLSFAETDALSLRGSVVAAQTGPALRAEGAHVRGTLMLGRCRMDGETRLADALIDGHLWCRDAYLRGRADTALYANGLRVGGNVLLDTGAEIGRGFKAEGAVLLVGAEIAGDLKCGGGSFVNRGALALGAVGIHVAGSLTAGRWAHAGRETRSTNRMAVEGEVNLLAARIDGNLSLTGGRFKNPGANAIFAPGIKVGTTVSMREFYAEGTVSFAGAEVGRNFECRFGRFSNPGKPALVAAGMVVSGDARLDEGFLAEGTVVLEGARVGGDLDFSNATFRRPAPKEKAGSAPAVRLNGARIGGDLNFTGGRFSGQGATGLEAQNVDVMDRLFWRQMQLESPADAFIDLRRARVGTLVDANDGSWPLDARLSLAGLVYREIDGPTEARMRLGWIERQWRVPAGARGTGVAGRGSVGRQPNPAGVPAAIEFSAQPYGQLARVLRESGHERDAQAVQVARARALRRYGKIGWLAYCKNLLLDLTIGYGYHPFKAFYWSLLFVLVGWAVFAMAAQAGLMQRTNRLQGQLPSGAAELTLDREEAFSPLVYSLDTFLPLVGLSQREYWRPQAGRRGGCGLVPGRFLVGWPVVRCTPALAGGGATGWFTLSGWAVRAYRWMQILAGWLLTALFLAGVSGVVRRE